MQNCNVIGLEQRKYAMIAYKCATIAQFLGVEAIMIQICADN